MKDVPSQLRSLLFQHLVTVFKSYNIHLLRTAYWQNSPSSTNDETTDGNADDSQDIDNDSENDEDSSSENSDDSTLIDAMSVSSESDSDAVSDSSTHPPLVDFHRVNPLPKTGYDLSLRQALLLADIYQMNHTRNNHRVDAINQQPPQQHQHSSPTIPDSYANETHTHELPSPFSIAAQVLANLNSIITPLTDSKVICVLYGSYSFDLALSRAPVDIYLADAVTKRPLSEHATRKQLVRLQKYCQLAEYADIQNGTTYEAYILENQDQYEDKKELELILSTFNLMRDAAAVALHQHGENNKRVNDGIQQPSPISSPSNGFVFSPMGLSSISVTNAQLQKKMKRPSMQLSMTLEYTKHIVSEQPHALPATAAAAAAGSVVTVNISHLSDTSRQVDQLIRASLRTYPHARQVILFLKQWAHARGLLDPKALHGISSLTLYSLVFFLYQQYPASTPIGRAPLRAKDESRTEPSQTHPAEQSDVEDPPPHDKSLTPIPFMTVTTGPTQPPLVHCIIHTNPWSRIYPNMSITEMMQVTPVQQYPTCVVAADSPLDSSPIARQWDITWASHAVVPSLDQSGELSNLLKTPLVSGVWQTKNTSASTDTACPTTTTATTQTHIHTQPTSIRPQRAENAPNPIMIILDFFLLFGYVWKPWLYGVSLTNNAFVWDIPLTEPYLQQGLHQMKRHLKGQADSKPRRKEAFKNTPTRHGTPAKKSASKSHTPGKPHAKGTNATSASITSQSSITEAYSTLFYHYTTIPGWVEHPVLPGANLCQHLHHQLLFAFQLECQRAYILLADGISSVDTKSGLAPPNHRLNNGAFDTTHGISPITLPLSRQTHQLFTQLNRGENVSVIRHRRFALGYPPRLTTKVLDWISSTITANELPTTHKEDEDEPIDSLVKHLTSQYRTSTPKMSKKTSKAAQTTTQRGTAKGKRSTQSSLGEAKGHNFDLVFNPCYMLLTDKHRQIHHELFWSSNP